MDRIQKNIIRNGKGGEPDDYLEKEEETNKKLGQYMEAPVERKKEAWENIWRQTKNRTSQNIMNLQTKSKLRI